MQSLHRSTGRLFHRSAVNVGVPLFWLLASSGHLQICPPKVLLTLAVNLEVAPVPSRGAHFQGCFAARDLTIGTQTSSHSSVGLRVPGLACNLCFLLLRRGRNFNLNKMTKSTTKDELSGHQKSGKEEVTTGCRIRCQRQQLRWQPGSTGGLAQCPDLGPAYNGRGLQLLSEGQMPEWALPW